MDKGHDIEITGTSRGRTYARVILTMVKVFVMIKFLPVKYFLTVFLTNFVIVFSFLFFYSYYSRLESIY